ncbi:hypothetical protein TRFO_34981 [Tritrichomonas foetus]|uniref:Uncharacterized protein n=1 Tax=Tritrichomonas foetus TaxID=1144522 RepID=A0A1J4JHI3_9EUKA|nr:hypothetical protein TRFO_34981 [Tritrichomonas foetus]|eukprot:OHS98610.1 hypothetical protein TRFO_34981 [Tritrichomonas foetus]
MNENYNSLIIMDFLYQKFEFRTTESKVTPEDIIKDIRKDFFPSERNIEISKGFPDYTKYCLFIGFIDKINNDLNESKRYMPIEFVSSSIDIKKFNNLHQYQFFIFRPKINVFLTVQYQDAEEQFIIPVKKTYHYLKCYLKNKAPSFNIQHDFNFLIIDENGKTSPLDVSDNDYIECNMNMKRLSISEIPGSPLPPYQSPLKFNYTLFGQGSKWPDKPFKTMESIDIDEKSGFMYADLKSKLIEKHQSGQSVSNENVVIIFNGVIQSPKFRHIDDLLSDHDFYKFVVLFESSELKIKKGSINGCIDGGLTTGLYSTRFNINYSTSFVSNFANPSDSNDSFNVPTERDIPGSRCLFVSKGNSMETLSLLATELESQENNISHSSASSQTVQTLSGAISTNTFTFNSNTNSPPGPDYDSTLINSASALNIAELKQTNNLNQNPNLNQNITSTSIPLNSGQTRSTRDVDLNQPKPHQNSDQPPQKYSPKRIDQGSPKLQNQRKDSPKSGNRPYDEISDEELVDMFCFYFNEYQKAQPQTNTPPPSYFAHISDGDQHLLNVFKTHFLNYMQQQ